MLDQDKGRGIIIRLIEKGLEIYIRKECNEIRELKINIFASAKEIIKGLVNKINILAKNINYKELKLDKIELEAKDINISYKLNSNQLKFKNNFKVNFEIILSENSLKEILLYSCWSWIGDMISKEILNLNKLKDINIKNDKIQIKGIKNTNIINKIKQIDIKLEKGKIYLEEKSSKKLFKIPIEDKVYIKNIYIHKNLIYIKANSLII